MADLLELASFLLAPNPAAVLTLSPSASVQEGERVTLTCDVPGEEKQEVHYSWYKNNVWIKAGTARTLVFHEAVAEDTGYFSCKVQNDKGSEMSPAVVLTVFCESTDTLAYDPMELPSPIASGVPGPSKSVSIICVASHSPGYPKPFTSPPT